MDEAKILPVIVLYNSNLEEQYTYRTLLKCNNWDKYIVYDNSDWNKNNRINDPRIIYIRDSRNSGLSKAYNVAAKYAKIMGYEWLLLLDQDSSFPINSYNIYKEAIKNNRHICLFAPRLTYKLNKPFSPSWLCCGISIAKRFTEGVYSLNSVIPVNSGMCISVREFCRCGGYDENLKLDFTDVRFIDKFKRYNKIFYLLDCDVSQSFSNEVKDSDKLIFRYKQFLFDAICYERTNIICNIRVFFLVLKHTLALIFKTKKSIFIPLYINYYLFKKK